MTLNNQAVVGRVTPCAPALSNETPARRGLTRPTIRVFALILLLSTLIYQPSTSRAQYSITWDKIAGGGGASTGGVYTISDTIGQHDAAALVVGGAYSITSGFWAFEDAVAPGQPVLALLRTNNVITVVWPLTAADYCLETTFNLAPPVVWQTVTSGLSTNGASLVLTVTNNPSIPKQFFRLANPCTTPTPVALAFQVSNNVSSVSWPVGSFRLQTTFSLKSPVTWQSVSNGISTVGSFKVFTFTNNPSVTNQFFRLTYP